MVLDLGLENTTVSMASDLLRTVKVKLATLVEADPAKVPFQGVGAGATPSPRLHNFTLDPYLMMLSVMQRGIKYHFLSLWYDLGSNPGLLDHWQMLYSLDQWTGYSEH